MSDNNQPPKSPYVGLVPFSEDDAQFFFGRERERDIIIENLRASRLTLLYGASGVGKSSVLNAGVVYSLNQLAHRALEEQGKPDFAVIIFSDWSNDPIAGFMQSVQKAVAKTLEVETIEAVPDSGDIVEMLKAWSERFGLELLIILDQFEEYFNYLSNEKIDNSFAAQLPRAITSLDLRAKFVISLREDSLAKLDRFKPEIPHIFDNTYRLEHMDEDAASDAIIKPLDIYNKISGNENEEEKFEIEPKLVEEIINQLTNPENPLNSGSQNEILPNLTKTPIEAPYLQLVMTRLWEKEQSENSRVLRLKTLKTMEGLKNIVQTHVNNALNSLASNQREIAADIFKYLVTPSGTKLAYTESDLAGSAGVDLNKLSLVLIMLSDSRWRILRLVDPPLNNPKESRYEVFHDVLAKAILRWLSEYKQSVRERKRLFRFGFIAAGIILLLLLASGAWAVKIQWQADDFEKQKVEELNKIGKEQEARLAEAKREEEAKLFEAERQRLTEKNNFSEKRKVEIEKANEKLTDALREARIAKDSAEDAKLRADKSAEELEVALKNQKRATDEAISLNLTLKARNTEIANQNAEIQRLSDKRDQNIIEILNDSRKKISDPIVLAQISKIFELLGLNSTNSGNNSNQTSDGGDPIATKKWKNGQTLRIKFMDGSPVLQKKVKEIAQEWTKYANLKFVFGDFPSKEAQIRISFNNQEGSWSYIGTDALGIPTTNQTMNLGYLEMLDSEGEEFRRYVLHEFGHMVGLIHEHQQANANIPWNKDFIYKLFTGPPNYWDRQQVDLNLFRRYSSNYRPFDRDSIMIGTTIPKEWLLDDSFEPITKLNTNLSESDKALVRRLYPPN